MKKIAIILMTLLVSFFLLEKGNAVHASELGYNSSDWILRGNYYYYELPHSSTLYTDYNMKIVAPANAILEYNPYDAYAEEPIRNKYFKVRQYEDGTYNKVSVSINSKGFINMSLFNANVKDVNSVFHHGFYNGASITDYHVSTDEDFENLKTNKSMIRYHKSNIWVEPNGSETINNNINELPKTKELADDLGVVRFKTEGLKLTVSIDYENTRTFVQYNFAENSDMSMFDTIEAYFMNLNNNPEIFINLDPDRMYLKDIITSDQAEKVSFVPHTIWTLRTNNIKSNLSYKAHVFIKQNNKAVHMAYLYIDEFVIDNMLSATVNWVSYREHKFPSSIIYGDTSDWEPHRKTLVNDQYLEYRDRSFSWYTYLSGLAMISAGVRWNVVQKIPEIQAVDFSNLSKDFNITKSEVNGHMTKVSKDFDGLSNNPRYKLWALALQEGVKDVFGSNTVIYHDYDNLKDPNNLKVMEIIYETDGKIYATFGNEIDTVISAPESEVGNGTVDKTPFEESGILRIIILIDIALILLAIFMPLIQKGKFLKPRELIGVLLTIVLLSIIIYFGIQYGITGELLSIILRL